MSAAAVTQGGEDQSPVEAAEAVTAAAALPPLTDDQCHRIAALLASVGAGGGEVACR